MDDAITFTLSAHHIWQGPIPAKKLQRLKSFAMTGLKNFWAEDLEEYSTYQFIPSDSDASLTVVAESEDLYEAFDEEYSLDQFQRVVFHYSLDMPVEISVPPNLTMTQEKLDEIWKDTAEAHEYISDLEERTNTAEGFSSILLEQGGFQSVLTIEGERVPKSSEDIYLVISTGSSKLGEFEYLHGLFIKNTYYKLSDYENGSYCDHYYHTYYDEKFNLICRFNQWFAGLEVDEIGDDYISGVSEDLIDAYIATNFNVHTDPPFTLKIGDVSRQIRNLLEEHKCSTAAYVTAWNPYGKALTDAENKERNKALKSSLSDKYRVYKGLGTDPLGEWPGEESFLILGINRQNAMKLGTEFEQNAIVFIEDAVPELIMLV